jgi:hypothetical protein
MNARITGSSEFRKSSGVPSSRHVPSYSIANRSATRKALSMSWVMTIPVTPSSSFIRLMSRSTTARVMGSSPVVGSS